MLQHRVKNVDNNYGFDLKEKATSSFMEYEFKFSILILQD